MARVQLRPERRGARAGQRHDVPSAMSDPDRAVLQEAVGELTHGDDATAAVV